MQSVDSSITKLNNATGPNGSEFDYKHNFLDNINSDKICDQDMAILCQGPYKLGYKGKRFHDDEEISLAIYKHREKLKKTSLKYFGYGLKSLISFYIISYAAIIALHGLMIYGTVACWKAYYISTGYTAFGYFILGIILVRLALEYFTMYVVPVNYAEEDKTLKNCESNERYYTYIRDKGNYQIIRDEIFTELAKNEYTSIKDIIKKNHKDSNGNTLLHKAVMNNDSKFITILLENGADPSIKNKDDLNPLSLAINNERKQAFDLIIAIYNTITYKNLVIDATNLNKDATGIVATYITGLDQSITHNLSSIDSSQQANKYLEAMSDAMSKVMTYRKKYYYRLELYNAISINYDKLSRISRKKHRSLFNTACKLLYSEHKPDDATEKAKFERALINGTKSLKESLLLAINNGNDQLAAKLCQWFYKLHYGKRIHADEDLSLEIYKHRKKLKKTNLKYFGYGLKALRNYYIISYATILALHGLIIYEGVACINAFYASPLKDFGDYTAHSAEGYNILGCLLIIIAGLWIGMYSVPVAYAGRNTTLKNCVNNEKYYKTIVNNTPPETLPKPSPTINSSFTNSFSSSNA